MIQDIDKIIQILLKAYPTLPLMDLAEGDPYKTLVSTILSQRAKDEMTIKVADRLFQTVGETPQDFEKVSLQKLEKLIYQSGTYTQKAKNIKASTEIILKTYKGKVPHTLEELIALPGVGRKTANIVLNNCFDIPAIAVDTHVHRISNRLGWVKTTQPEKTEMALMKVVPQKHWSDINHVMVRHGQECCKPIKPLCEKCPIRKWCAFGNSRS